MEVLGGVGSIGEVIVLLGRMFWRLLHLIVVQEGLHQLVLLHNGIGILFFNLDFLFLQFLDLLILPDHVLNNLLILVFKLPQFILEFSQVLKFCYLNFLVHKSVTGKRSVIELLNG